MKACSDRMLDSLHKYRGASCGWGRGRESRVKKNKSQLLEMFINYIQQVIDQVDHL